MLSSLKVDWMVWIRDKIRIVHESEMKTHRVHSPPVLQALDQNG
jgi:hypothetical protein